MAPRGLSAEEKRVKLLEIFHETKDFFQLKELEKMGPKMKGIVSQSVKEVLQSLVDDGLVQGDKIGSSNFFWSFPSQQGALAQTRVKSVKDTEANNQAQLEELHKSIAAEQALRPDSKERRQSLEQLASLKKDLIKLDDELKKYGACDPVKLEELRRGITLGKEAALRWTDNLSVLISHHRRQNQTEETEIRRFLEIGDDYEDIC